MKRTFFITITCLITNALCSAQGVIVNEISQGPAGAQEFIELLVVGSTAQPGGTVDLRDWIIDDNNGAFQLSDNSAPGVATGHFRFAINDTMAAVPVGALLVIYNAADPNPAWNFRQLNNNNIDIAHIEDNGLTYYIPGTSTLLKACSGTPSSSSTSYIYINGTVPPTVGNWTGQIGLANSGDAIQLRKPDGSFYHGFGFSTPSQSNNFQSFPVFSDGNLPSFNGFLGVATGKVSYLDCGSYYYGSNYLTGQATTDETPGQANNANNTLLINNIRNGLFRYDQLGQNRPCSEMLPVKLLHFNGKLIEHRVHLTWMTSFEYNNAHFNIQRSTDQKQWIDIGSLKGRTQSQEEREYTFTDQAPLSGLSFYRLEQTDLDGQKDYSPVLRIHYNGPSGQSTVLYPNPVNDDRIKVTSNQEIKNVRLYDILGRMITPTGISHNNLTYSLDIDVSTLVKGHYYMKIQFTSGSETLPFSKN